MVHNYMQGVRITHIPTGIVAEAWSSMYGYPRLHMHELRLRAMCLLRTRLFATKHHIGGY